MPRPDDVDEDVRRRRHKRAKKQLEQDLRTAQEESLHKDQQIQRMTQQIAVLQQNQEAAHQDNVPAAQMSGDSALAQWKRCASSAGRRAAVMHMPFMDADYLFDHRVQIALPRLVLDVQKASLNPDDPEADDEGHELLDEDNPRLYWEYYHFNIPDAVTMVREVIYVMPPDAGKRWFKRWFKQSFLEGYRKIKSDVVFHVAKNHLAIFGIANPLFRNKKERTRMPEVEELRSTFQYQFVGGVPDIPSFYRHQCILGTVRYIFLGESSIETGERSSKARHSHSELWHANEVTPSVLAFAATVIDFVLSGEPTFEQSANNSNYLHFFRARLELMRNVEETHPQEFAELLFYYNQSVFPGLYPRGEDPIEDEDGVIQPPDLGMTQADAAFLEGL